MSETINTKLNNLLICAQAEVADVDLYAPSPPREDCPICLLRRPISEWDNVFVSCCGNMICCGCMCGAMRAKIMNGLEYLCPFCRQPKPEGTTYHEKIQQHMQKGIPYAFIQKASAYRNGNGVPQSDIKALEMFIKAAELGYADAYVNIANHYWVGILVEVDKSKRREFLVIAAKKGSIGSHQLLADLDAEEGNIEMAIKHMTVTAIAGCQKSMDNLMEAFRHKRLAKGPLAQTLRAFQASNDELMSKDRDEWVCYRAKRDNLEVSL